MTLDDFRVRLGVVDLTTATTATTTTTTTAVVVGPISRRKAKARRAMGSRSVPSGGPHGVDPGSDFWHHMAEKPEAPVDYEDRGGHDSSSDDVDTGHRDAVAEQTSAPGGAQEPLNAAWSAETEEMAPADASDREELISASVGRHVTARPAESPPDPPAGRAGRGRPARAYRRRRTARERSTTCEECGKEFSNVSNLNKHRKSHARRRAAPPVRSGDGDAVAEQTPADGELLDVTWGAETEELAPADASDLAARPADSPPDPPAGRAGRGKPGRAYRRRRTARERSTTCEECGKEFSNVSNLNKHRKSHARRRAAPPVRYGDGDNGDNGHDNHDDRDDRDACERDAVAEQTPAPRGAVSPEGTQESQGEELLDAAWSAETEEMAPADASDREELISASVARHVTARPAERPPDLPGVGAYFVGERPKRAYRKRRTRERSTTCDECGKGFSNVSNLNKHRKSHAGERPHACADCGKRFMSRSDLRKHEDTHTGARSNACADCGATFSNRSNLWKHERTHAGALTHACAHCGKSFLWTSQLRQHLMTHTGERPHVCPDCGRRFVQPCNLREHAKTHAAAAAAGQGVTGAAGASDAVEGDGENAASGGAHRRLPHACPECGRHFATASALEAHLRAHEVAATAAAAATVHACAECGKVFADAKAVRRHRLTHSGERPYACGECGRTFPRTCSLRKHRRTHAGQRSHGCRECRRKFPNVAALRKHQKTVHRASGGTAAAARGGALGCQECAEGFADIEDLRRHEMTHTHARARPHVCQECGRSFSLLASYKKHCHSHDTAKS
ncbi:zinc finger protein 497-like isoform X1 [Lethenteron reissneri]|uniref:zinc finger protein 497-like isoform X1 n=2 Tax=Lethenteron reissneri TaxID=7753 RepID=UPI002AB7CB77|nr:zinc finger protein 497-like isoform X1 [Lethenteron reissneri]